MANLFTSQTPSSTNNSDGTPTIVTATTLVFAVSGEVTGVRYYATDNTDGTWTGYLWQPTASDSSAAGTLLASKVGSVPSGGTWNTITFDTPVAVSAGVAYRVGIHSGDGRYVFTGSFFAGQLVNGDITGIANGATVGGLTLSNGTFRIDSAAGYPSSGGGGCYFADVEFTASSSPTPIAVGDAGSAVSSLLAGASAPITDAGSAAEVVAAAVALSFGDTAAAAEAAAVIVAAGLADAGTSGEALTVAVAAALADAGLAVDLGDGEDDSNIQKALADIGSAVERLRTTTVRPSTGITTRPFTGITLRP